MLLMGLERALDRLQQGNRHRRKRSRMVLASPGLLLDHEMKYPQRPASDLTALGRGPKSWSWTIKGISRPPALRNPATILQSDLLGFGTLLLKWKF